MTAKAGASSGVEQNWNRIDWVQLQENVKRLQMRIAQAVSEKRWNKVKALQWLLTHSKQAKLLAVKRVTSNRGKNTPGVDGVVWRVGRQKILAALSLKRHGYKPLPLRRIYIPKRDGRKRPLSIPTMYDRAMQALYMMALVPVAETTAEWNSYGFRENRSCADAMVQIFICLSGRNAAPMILEGDIKSCFDTISHEWMIQHIPMDAEILRKFLQAGYLEQGKYFETKEGTPQGGVISPILANMVLDGLEEAVRKAVPRRSRVNVIRFADDFIITALNEELLRDHILPALTTFLKERGLELSPTKTVITSLRKGFDFLGQNVRRYGTGRGKLLIKPSRTSIDRMKENIRQTLRRGRGWPVKNVVKALNSRIRGWAMFHRHAVSSETFGSLDNFLYSALWRWIRRYHRKKSNRWLRHKYWSLGEGRTFSVKEKVKQGRKEGHRYHVLTWFRTIRLVRYIKVRGEANPYSRTWTTYFQERRQGKRFRPC